MKKETYTVFSKESDITFIMEDTFDNDNELVSTEVKGFYYGVPDKEATFQFYGKLKAEY